MGRESTVELPAKLMASGIAKETLELGQVQWTLPARPIGKLKYVLLILLLPTLLFLLPLILLVVRTLGAAGRKLAAGRLGQMDALTLGGIAFSAIALLVVGILFLVRPRPFRRFLHLIHLFRGVPTTRISLGNDHLRSMEGLERNEWMRIEIERDAIKDLRVISLSDYTRLRHPIAKRPKREASVSLTASLNFVLAAILKSGQVRPLAFAFPKPVLDPLLESLDKELGTKYSDSALFENRSENLSLQSGTDLFMDDDTAFHVGNLNTAQSGLDDEDLEVVDEIKKLYAKPVGSQIELEKREDGLKFSVPSRGVWKDSHGLVVFGILWIAFSLFIFAISIFKTPNPGGLGTILTTGLFGLFFVAIGCAILILGVHLGTRKSIVATSYGSLFVSTESRVMKSTRSFEPDAIDYLEVQPSGFEVNKRPVFHVKLVNKVGPGYGFLSQASVDEQDWVTQELNADLAKYRDGQQS